jgi:RND family efflux transporter MFP subunit
VLAAWAVTAQASHEIVITEAQMQRLGIATGPVATAEGVQTDALPARVVIPPDQEQVVSAPKGGLVVALHAAAEQPVAAGDSLAEIRSPDLVTLQQDFLEALSEGEVAKAAVERDRKLVDEGIIPKRRFEETRSRYRQAQARLEARRHALRLAGMPEQAIGDLAKTRKLSSRLTVTAPIDGVVVEKMVSVGKRVQQAEPLYRVARLSPLWLEIRMPLGRLQGVKEGAPVSVPCAGMEAEVALVGRTAETESQTVLVRARVVGGEDCLRPGQFVETRLEVGAGEARFRVAGDAVVRYQGRDWVFVRVANGFRPVAVDVHGHRQGEAVVSGPLKAGQKVAVSGLAVIKGAWSGYGEGE